MAAQRPAIIGGDPTAAIVAKVSCIAILTDFPLKVVKGPRYSSIPQMRVIRSMHFTMVRLPYRTRWAADLMEQISSVWGFALGCRSTLKRR
ncbi:hypothetical protein IE4803_PB00491 (plasmid) [Rhizobium etli bv. phaseoli str. IE4803]|nr:hypothetical protein IE4803_PB00491 [Rhizobium etli bv. phaseoli str. IE4803]